MRMSYDSPVPLWKMIGAAALFGTLAACASEPPPLDSVSAIAGAVSGPGGPESYEVVDCLLPGQIRQLGTKTTYVTERRPARTTKEDCVIRGGEYVAVDRADYQSALKIWLSAAQHGSAEAQYYAATIYERGHGAAPDYQQAASWYRKSAEQGDKRAAVGLARLYEQGLGVPKDPAEAFKWFARASGLSDGALSLLVHTPDSGAVKRIHDLEQALVGKEREVQKLSAELRDVNKEVAALRTGIKERTKLVQQASDMLKERERQAAALQSELVILRTRPDSKPQTAALEQQIARLQSDIARETDQLANKNSEILQLQDRIAGLEKNAGRIQVLEQTVARQDSEALKLRNQLTAADQELKQLSGQLEERQRLAAEDRRKSQTAERQYKQASAELELLRAKPDQSGAIAQSEETVKRLQEEMERTKQELAARNKDLAQFQQKVAALEADAEKQAKALQIASVNDLGFDGPSLEIIDPPLARTRGIQVAKDDLALPVSTGARRSIAGRVLAPAGLKALTVNGETVKVNEQGVFTTTLPALRSNADEIPVQILAIDMQNKRAALKFVLKARSAVPIIAATKQDFTKFGRYHALVIGNDHYKHWPELMNAVADAAAIAKTLKERYGFQVTLLKDATRAQIMKALNEYRKILTEKDNLLIYYAGHGHLEQGIDRGYWIPIDAETNDNSEWVLLPSVTDMLQLISAKHVMVVADSCFGGKLTRSSLAQLKPGLTDDARLDLLTTLAQKRVRTAMTSGGVKPVLDAGGSGHSVFAEAFLGVLDENNTVLEAERLFWAVRTRVVSTSQKLNAEQIPTYDPIHMAGHESLGDFIFVPRAL